MSDRPMESINIPESELYDNVIEKLDNIKNNIIKIKNYTNSALDDTNKSIKFLESFNNFSLGLNHIKSQADDMFNEFILKLDPNELSNEDKNQRNSLIIEKKIQDIFIPYMLYLQIILNNST